MLAAIFALSPLDGATEEKHIADVKELSGTWQGWVTREEGQERATLGIRIDAVTVIRRAPKEGKR